MEPIKDTADGKKSYTATYNNGILAKVTGTEKPDSTKTRQYTAVYDQYGNLLRKVTAYTGEDDPMFDMMSTTEDFSDMELDNAGRIVKQRELSASGTTANYEKSFSYDGAGNCVREERKALNEGMEPASEITSRTFDESGNMTSEIIVRQMTDGTEATVTKNMEYDSEGRMTYQKADADGEIVEVQYTYEPV